ncbi:response regulator [Sandaracinus amylolyticus]|uniref:Response regulatory domain-containing protein n=1 Tax=Sandaracinus amylolyticus TaxID=927083 RepID=A0A0F6YK61_9BACT|nr:response regulator [Sandaracinus amylolyticus]AKF07982.1 hypothetical protein DB32_005131 [Sandaracinus amylolyticus]
MKILLIEDGQEYEEFARLFLADACDIAAAHSASEALSRAAETRFDAFLVDLRFERAPQEALVGDLEDTARRLFGGDRARALRWLKDQQGTLVLAELRRAGHAQPALFVHDFPAQRLANLRRLYGDVRAVPGFDAAAIREALGVAR